MEHSKVLSEKFNYEKHTGFKKPVWNLKEDGKKRSKKRSKKNIFT